MSTTIDQRVVEMRFDNQQFESNVSTTMSTLDKLKQKLNLSGAAKGLDNIGTAAKKVDLSNLGNGADAVAVKFSHMQMTIQHQLDRIVDNAFRAGKNIVKALTIDPVKTGFEEYETKMGSIQTILANTEHQGTTLDDVTAALDKLNLYADKTIYNFQQMTKNIGTFTAAGVDLQTSVNSIQGIANLAAVSGSTSQQASTAMYQLSQALASGTVKLMDWNSVVNAGMGGKVFQNALIRTAAMLDGSAEKVEEWQKKHIDQYGSFRESLSKEQWLTTEVLTKTLEQFTMAAEEGSDEWNEFKKSLMSDGYTEKQAEEILKMANTATDAATKVKTFTQLMDTLKESAQSGWAQTWEILIGDFEEAKEFFTGLSDLFGGILGESADRRNTLLSGAFDSNWDKLVSKINEAGIKTADYEESIRKIVGDDPLDELITDYGSLEKAIREGAISSDILKKALSEIAGTNADSKISGFVDGLKEIERTLRRGNVGEDVKKLQTALDELGYDLGTFGVDGIIGPVTEKAIRAFQEAEGLVVDGIAGPETIAALEKAGTKVEEIAGDVDGLVDSCDELIDVITKTSGRELLLDSLMNVIKAIQRPLAAVGEAFRNVFAVTPEQLYNVLEGLNKFTSSLVMGGVLDATTWSTLTDKISQVGIETKDFESKLTETLKKGGVDVDKLIDKYGDLGTAFEKGAISVDHIKEALLGFDGISESLLEGGEAADKVRRTFEGLFSVLKLVGTIVAGPIKLAFDVITKVLGKFGLGLLDVTALLGDSLGTFANNMLSAIDGVTDVISSAVVEWINRFKETKIFKTVAEWFKEASKTIADSIAKITEKIAEFDVGAIVDRLETFSGFLSRIADSLANSETFIAIVDGVCAAFAKLKEFIPKFKIPEFNLTNLNTFTKALNTITGTDISGFTGTLSGLGTYLKDSSSLKWTTFKNTAFEKFVNFWLSVGDKAKLAFEKCKEVAIAIKEFIFGTEDVNLPAILNIAQKFLGILVLFKTLETLNSLVAPFDNITEALNNFASAMKWRAMTEGFKAMAVAIGVLAVCIIVLANLVKEDLKGALIAAGMIAGLMIIMGGVVSAMAFFASKVEGGVNAAGAALSLLAMIGAIALLVYAIKEIDKIDLKDPIGTFGLLLTTIGVMAAGVRIIAAAGGSSFKSVAAILTLVTALKMLLDVIDAYDQYDWTGKSKAIERMMSMLIGLSAALGLASSGVKAGASASGLALLLLSMVFSLKLLLNVMKEFAAVDTGVLIKGGLAVTALLTIMSLLVAVVNASSDSSILKKGERSVNNFAGLAFALFAVVASIWALGKLATSDIESFKYGVTTVAGVLLLFTAMLAALGLACSGLKIGSIIAMMIAIGLLMAEAAIIIHTMETVPWQSALSSAAALGGLLLAIAGVCKALGTTPINADGLVKWIAAIGVMTLIIYALSQILLSIDSLQPGNSIGNAIALSALLVTMAGVMHALSSLDMRHFSTAKLKKLALMFVGMTAILGLLGLVLAEMSALNVSNAGQNASALCTMLGMMTIVIAVLGTIKVDKSLQSNVWALTTLIVPLFLLTEVLRNMNGVENAIANATALSILAIALSACTIPLAVASKMAPSMLPGVFALTSLAAVLGLLVSYLSSITGVENARQNAITLAGLAAVLSVCTIALAAAGLIAMSGSIVPGVTALVVVASMLGIVVYVLSTITGIETARANAITLANLAIVLTACVAVLAVVGLLVPGVIAGTVALIGIATVLGLLVAGLSIIDGIETARANVMTLIILLTSLTNILIILSTVGDQAMPGVTALNNLITVFTRFGALLTVVGGLTKHIDSIEDFIDKGIEVFKKLARGLGEIIAEFATGASSGLEEVGENIGKFMEGAGGFIEKVSGVDAGIVDGATNLAKAVGSIIDIGAQMKLCGMDGESLTAIAEDLTGFATKISDFMVAMSGVDSNATTSIQALSDLVGTFIELDTSGTELTTFSSDIESFAGAISSASESLSSITDADVENIKRSATAGAALAELADSLPKTGMLQVFTGISQDLGTFSEDVVAFGQALVAYSGSVSGKNIDTAAIEDSTAAAMALSDLANAVPAADGLYQVFAGYNSLTTFGEDIKAFGTALVAYSDSVSGKNIDTAAIETSASAAEALAAVAEKIPESGGWLQKFTGSHDMGAFGTGLAAFADGMVTYATAAATIDDTAITNIENSGKAVDALAEVAEKIPESGGWLDKITGSKDTMGFAEGIKSLATAISSYCTVAASFGDDMEASLTAIENSETIVMAIAGIPDVIPDYISTEKVYLVSEIAKELSAIASTINSLTNASYDYTGMDTLQTAITQLVGLLDGIEVAEIYADFFTFKTAAITIKEAAAALVELNQYTYEGVDRFKESLTNLSGSDVQGVIDAFGGKAESMLTAVGSVVNAMVDGFNSGAPLVADAMRTLVDGVVTAAKEKNEDFNTAGGELTATFSSGITDNSGDAEAAGEEMAASAVAGARTGSSGAGGAGADLVAGFAAGITENTFAAEAAAVAMAMAALKAAKAALKINSPSKVFRAIGYSVPEGFAMGIDKFSRMSTASATAMANAAIGTVKKSISRIADVVNSDIDSNPTIRPVLDLSDIRAGAGSISSLLGSGQTIGLATNAGNISSMMNRRSQNGADSEIVSAINKLRKDLSNVGNTSYNINGITYDDGSNVATAMKEIVRAARTERRV